MAQMAQISPKFEKVITRKTKPQETPNDLKKLSNLGEIGAIWARPVKIKNNNNNNISKHIW
jgi:hypothetical protein